MSAYTEMQTNGGKKRALPLTICQLLTGLNKNSRGTKKIISKKKVFGEKSDSTRDPLSLSRKNLKRRRNIKEEEKRKETEKKKRKKRKLLTSFAIAAKKSPAIKMKGLSCLLPLQAPIHSKLGCS